MNQFATLLGWVPSTGMLTYSANGVTQTSRVQTSTKVHRAALNQYPTDPVRPIVQSWNARIDAIKGPATFGTLHPGSDVPNTFSGFTSQLVAAGAHMQINLKPNSTIIESLRPIATIHPTDPV